MTDNADDRRLTEPWHPVANPVTLKHFGKLGEELGELISAKDRCLIQGVDEAHPVTGKVNRDWLEDEIADVEAGLELLKRHLQLDRTKMHNRRIRKMFQLQVWHDKA